MAITFVNFSGAAGIAAVNPGLPADILTNDILILTIEGEGEDADADGAPSTGGWAAIDGSTGSVVSNTDGTADRTRNTTYWVRYNSASAPSTAVPDAGNHTAAVITAWRGCLSTASPIHATRSSSNATNSTAISVAGLTTTVDNCTILLLTTAGDDNGEAQNYPGTAHYSNWANANLASVTEVADVSGQEGSDWSIAVAYGRKLAAGATGATTADIVPSGEEANWCVALLPEPTAGAASEVANASDTLALGRSLQNATIADISKTSDTASVKNVGQDGAVGSHEFHIPFSKHYSSQRVVLSKAYWVERTGKPKVAVETAVTASDIVKASDTLSGLGTRAAAAAEVVETSDALVTRSVGQNRTTALRLASRIIITRAFWIEYRAQDANASVVTAATASDIVKTSDTLVKFASMFATVSEVVKASDTDAGSLTTTPILADIIKGSDTPSAAAEMFGALADIAEMFDLTSAGTGIMDVTSSDIVNVSDTIAGGMTAFALVFEVVNLSDVSSALATLARALAEGVKLSDSAAVYSIITALAYDGIKLSDTAATALATLIGLSEGIEVSDTGQVNIAIPITAAEGVKVSDVVVKVLNLFSTLADGITASESIDFANIKALRYPGKITISFIGKSARVTFAGDEPTVVAAESMPKMVFKVKK